MCACEARGLPCCGVAPLSLLLTASLSLALSLSVSFSFCVSLSFCLSLSLSLPPSLAVSRAHLCLATRARPPPRLSREREIRASARERRAPCLHRGRKPSARALPRAHRAGGAGHARGRHTKALSINLDPPSTFEITFFLDSSTSPRLPESVPCTHVALKSGRFVMQSLQSALGCSRHDKRIYLEQQ